METISRKSEEFEVLMQNIKYQKNEWYIFQNIKSYQNIFKLNIEAILELLITVTHLGAAHNQRNREQETENKNFK